MPNSKHLFIVHLLHLILVLVNVVHTLANGEAKEQAQAQAQAQAQIGDGDEGALRDFPGRLQRYSTCLGRMEFSGLRSEDGVEVLLQCPAT